MSKIENPELGCEFFEECLVRIGKIATKAIPRENESLLDLNAIREVMFEVAEHVSEAAFDGGFDCGFEDGYNEGYSEAKEGTVN